MKTNATVEDFEGKEIKVGNTVKIRYGAVATGVHHKARLMGVVESIKPDRFAAGFGLVEVNITGASNPTLAHNIGCTMTVYSSHVTQL